MTFVSIAVDQWWEREHHFWMSPGAACPQSTSGVRHQHIKRLLICYNLWLNSNVGHLSEWQAIGIKNLSTTPAAGLEADESTDTVWWPDAPGSEEPDDLRAQAAHTQPIYNINPSKMSDRECMWWSLLLLYTNTQNANESMFRVSTQHKLNNDIIKHMRSYLWMNVVVSDVGVVFRNQLVE